MSEKIRLNRHKQRIKNYIKNIIENHEKLKHIKMHGGEIIIEDLNLNTGSVNIRLGGACTDCVLSDTTIHLVEEHLPNEVQGTHCRSIN